MNIRQHITTLLYRHDCVIVPGLGGFVANHHPSRLQDDLELAFPPSKVIIFNKHLLTNDGLLAETIAREEELSFSDASEAIRLFTLELRDRMNKGERIPFEGLGLLFLDEENSIQFQPDYSRNFLVEAFGLHPVVAREIVKEKTTPEKDQIKEAIVIPIEKAEEIHVRERSAMRRYWPVAAAMIPLIFYSIWIPTKTEFLATGRIEFADLNPFRTNEIVYQVRDNQPVFSIEKPVDEWAEIIASAGGPIARLPLNDQGSYLNISVTIDNPEAESTFVSKRNASKRSEYHHHIIGGCFRELSNAEKLVSDLKAKGHDAYILDEKGGLHRVAINSFQSKSEATSALSKIRSEGINTAWLLEK